MGGAKAVEPEEARSSPAGELTLAGARETSFWYK